MLTDEQLKKIKEHFLGQIQNLPENQREAIKEKITSMNAEEMEAFLKENNLNTEQEQTGEPQKCIFCSIVKKEINSYIIDEDEKYIAILELNPLSKGHTLIIPKDHIPLDKIHESAIEFAKKVSKVLSKKLNPTDIQFQKNEVLGHADLEVIPVYGEEKLEKKRASEDELRELYNKIKAKDETPAPKEEKPEEKIELPKIKPRIGWI